MADIGHLYVIAAPSGTGKTTLVKALIEAVPKLMVSISHTTRAKRPDEVQSVHYHFVELTEFKKMIAHHDFLEYATIFDHYYGTSKRWVEDTLAQGVDVILEIDWQGHQQIKQLFPDALGIFVLPPSMQALKERLLKRNQDRPDVIEKRLADAKEAVSHLHEFDYLIINDDFTHALTDLKIIVESGRLLRSRQTAKFAALIESLEAISE